MTMKSVDLPHLRSVVLTGHVGAGKTTLAEQLCSAPGRSPGWAGSTTGPRTWTSSPRSRSGASR